MTGRSADACRLVLGVLLTGLLRLGAAEVTVTLLNTGDLHESSANLARIAALVAARKAADPNVLYVDCGDLLNRGDPAFQITRGAAMFETLSACGLDAAVLGNHDLSFGTAHTAALIDRFHYPLTDANSVWPAGLEPRAAPPYRLFRLKGVTVALVGTSSEHINHRLDDLVFRRRVVEAIRYLATDLRALADIVVLLTHVGGERDEALAAQLGAEFPGRPPVDLILGAHDHEAYPELRVQSSSGIAIQHSGELGRWLGETVLTWDGSRVSGRRSRLLPITADLPEDPAVAALGARVRSSLPAARPLLRLSAATTPPEFTPWLGRLAATQAAVDVALLPADAVRQPLPAGDLLPATMVQVVSRLEPLCFTVPSLAALQARLAAVADPARRPLLCTVIPHPPRRRALRVAWFCAYADAPSPPAPELDPLTAAAPDLQRRTGLSLWDVIVTAAAAARARGEPCANVDVPAAALAPAASSGGAL